MKGVFVLAFLIAMICSPVFARSTRFDDCKLPSGGKSTASLADFPPIIARLTRGLGAVDGPIRTDALLANETRPPHRLVRAFNLRRRWVIVYDVGSIALFQNMTVYALSKDGTYAKLIGTDHESAPDCLAITAALQPAMDD
jgi:hypothetical protein